MFDASIIFILKPLTQESN